MNGLFLTEPLPVLSLLGGAHFELIEPTPLFALEGQGGAALVLVEPIPTLQMFGYGGVLSLTEPLPVLSATGAWLSTANLSLTEPLPVFAFTGQRRSVLSLTEPLPVISLAEIRHGILSLTEPLPTVAFTGERFAPGVLSLVEPYPILTLIGFIGLASEAAAPADVPAGSVRPLSDYTAWAVNTANAAHSGFTDYEFNSLLFFNGKYYGTRSDGLFELTGDTDDGAEIQAQNSWGSSELGTEYAKRFYRAIFKIRDRGGKLLLGITPDEDTQTPFDVDPTRKDGLHRLTVRGRRDVHGTEMAPELRNVTGSDFDVHEFDIEPQVLKRGRG